MYQFEGIAPRALELLALNRFHDSKAFYEAHKEELKRLATIPMRHLVTDLSQTLLDLDGQMYLHPVYTVARIRRDTRRTKDKMMYRENLWLMMRRNKNEWSNVPVMWFEFSPECYSYGIAFYTDKPSDMAHLRAALAENPTAFRKALRPLLKTGLEPGGAQYKKKKDGNVPKALEPYYNAKNLAFVKTCPDLSRIARPDLVDELIDFIHTAGPMYRYLMNVHDRIAQGGAEE